MGTVSAVPLFIEVRSCRDLVIIFHRNELVDRLEQAKVVVQQRDEAVEEMQSLLLSTQEQLKRSPNLYRPPFVQKTWVVKELTIPRIKKSYVPRLVTVENQP